LLQDAHPHVAHVTTKLLNKFDGNILTHPPYSPDLAPSKYHLFLHTKKHMSGKTFDVDDKVEEKVNN